jgi:hypothetical protein
MALLDLLVYIISGNIMDLFLSDQTIVHFLVGDGIGHGEELAYLRDLAGRSSGLCSGFIEPIGPSDVPELHAKSTLRISFLTKYQPVATH